MTHTGKHIFIVGSQRFQNEIIAQYISDHFGATCLLFDSLRKLPPVCGTQAIRNLILLDCLHLSTESLHQSLREHTATLKNNIYLALFNLEKHQMNEAEFLKFGVRGIFYQQDSADILIKGIRIIFKDEVWFSRKTMSEYLLSKEPTPHCPPPTHIKLTSREEQILGLLAGGATNERIARGLCISQHTVKTHIYNIFKKINVPNRLQAALWATKYI